jgi:photosynthetic reaction center cytochrome c subunit
MQKRFLPKLSGLLLLLLIIAAALFSQTAPAKAPAKTAAEAFHNVQVLKDIPADELVPSMQFMTYSLGVECSYCHVEGALDKDDKKTKLTARKMMRMVSDINKDNFDSKQAVTCNSCHHGSPHPASIPMIAEFGTKPSMTHQSENPEANAPSPDEIISKYVNAIGGAAALAKINTRDEKGTITIGGHSLPLEILNSTGGKQLTLIHLPNGDNATAYDGNSGWTSAPNRPTHPIPSAEVVSARSETDLQLPLHLKQLFEELKRFPQENIGERETYVVAGLNAGQLAAKFYFDKDSGDLLRTVRYTKTPLGENPTQIDYADYRLQDGIKVPLRLTISRPNSSLAVQVDDVKFNVPIDDAKFAQPAAAPTSTRPSS